MNFDGGIEELDDNRHIYLNRCQSHVYECAYLITMPQVRNFIVTSRIGNAQGLGSWPLSIAVHTQRVGRPPTTILSKLHLRSKDYASR